jgi:hypothetical protein
MEISGTLEESVVKMDHIESMAVVLLHRTAIDHDIDGIVVYEKGVHLLLCGRN